MFVIGDKVRYHLSDTRKNTNVICYNCGFDNVNWKEVEHFDRIETIILHVLDLRKLYIGHCRACNAPIELSKGITVIHYELKGEFYSNTSQSLQHTFLALEEEITLI